MYNSAWCILFYFIINQEMKCVYYFNSVDYLKRFDDKHNDMVKDCNRFKPFVITIVIY